MDYTIRPCRTLEELSACVCLQKTIWGYTDHELYPLRLFVNLEKIGGHVLGAFAADGQLAGFVGSLPAFRGRLRYYHSLSLGVLAEHENRGLGRALKLEQRRAAIRVGINLIEWTFDPLRAKNGFFNIARLGAIARKYLPDHYGRVESRLQKGLPSDRLLAEWWLKSPRVKRTVKGKNPRIGKKPPAAEVSIPENIESLAESRQDEALFRQAEVRAQLQRCFARRLVITGFAHDENGCRYLLDREAPLSR